ncbi:pyruvate formate-lyase-activating enzyme (plasmid) [Peptoclostridium acidaminophilum DSM 3953]|uniref:Pyruvate formate-lyase-activating enzyme n=1 Tax=Peptoclostridium acidaminophilum DSM 3953 TaxID=1286171 RepID=W8TJB6_PEPAC|nr:pyruvate formate-lyase-activating protein [Peptoclostridium acidaminophilum]AHM57883.1 pyruvate formate-lyase-activating enzyme [Peptoclostridium acidaminophilum DSM 3953]
MKLCRLMKGKIHSIETMGLLDGPGIRFVAFFQGCPLRCSYCHNPDTWDIDGGSELSPQELFEKIRKYKPYFDKSGGGLTCSGGEPLLQPKFLLELLKLCNNAGLHTALDTSGHGLGMYEEILEYTDLVILDMKHSDVVSYKNLTQGSMDKMLDFSKVLKASDSKVWIRSVIVPGITDTNEHIKNVEAFAGKFPRLEKVEFLPYHKLGAEKYKNLGIEYRLEGTSHMCEHRLKQLTYKEADPI